MPISSGANRWPKSYWTKPQQPEVKLIKVVEQATAQSLKARNPPPEGSTDSPLKFIPDTMHEERPSDAQHEKQDNSNKLQNPPPPKRPTKQPARRTAEETSASTRHVFPLKLKTRVTAKKCLQFVGFAVLPLLIILFIVLLGIGLGGHFDDTAQAGPTYPSYLMTHDVQPFEDVAVTRHSIADQPPCAGIPWRRRRQTSVASDQPPDRCHCPQ